MFSIEAPLITSSKLADSQTVYAFNSGVKLIDVNVRISNSINRNHSKRQRSRNRMRRHKKY